VAPSAERTPQKTTLDASSVGVVVIGRNEGERLHRCLQSLSGCGAIVVYVDSGSDDDSVAHAAAMGCEVVSLDSSRPFTAARARNAGLDRLLNVHTNCRLVQFIDGDCEIAVGWAEAAVPFMRDNRQFGVVCGRRRERFPGASVYNRLCDIEWNTPVGEADSCGGDALMRVDALQAVGGFDVALIAGEEPELCARLRHAGWRIMRLDQEMSVHDANMMRFGQWWRRSTRAGWAFVSGAFSAGRSRKRTLAREAIRPWFWCFGVPVATIASMLSFGWWGLLPLLAYPLAIGRAARGASGRGGDLGTSLVFGVFCLLGKPAELQGQFIWIRDKLRRSAPRLVEYKRSA
jgi:glycosyltransferase involved in cell wall biosynthesis